MTILTALLTTLLLLMPLHTTASPSSSPPSDVDNITILLAGQTAALASIKAHYFSGAPPLPRPGFLLAHIPLPPLPNALDAALMLWQQPADAARQGRLRMALSAPGGTAFLLNPALGTLRIEGYVCGGLALAELLGEEGRPSGELTGMRDVVMRRVRDLEGWCALEWGGLGDGLG
ncbi:MAG: hypothetical protein M1829_002035 [Trizodia sp. TS-e1964]|nr:MAG: hypothetical protein M1829_002035 [Trizodia sp. TS-e1964]